ncbi:hypothetical protein GWI33_023397 [Rhynchophorus ferrugineus]|uniref:Uncharacterized protein n=1 Tax=Rhynchophorus ferrugineus TaxID=354439 RepID=A0A834IRC4_RHYFE|nr:hypothetical protein GWI33_023397 [Rhynchophorus ferrugineus]
MVREKNSGATCSEGEAEGRGGRLAFGRENICCFYAFVTVRVVHEADIVAVYKSPRAASGERIFKIILGELYGKKAYADDTGRRGGWCRLENRRECGAGGGFIRQRTRSG